MIVTQIAFTIFVLAAVVTFVAAQYVDHRDRDFKWVDYLGTGAMGIAFISWIVTLLAMVWGL
jgi:hypothetical protein